MNGPGELWVNQRSDELLEISFVMIEEMLKEEDSE
jgi:hypothetical protein